MSLSRSERLGLGLLLIIFTWFTWRGMTMFYSGDDMTNTYVAWDISRWRLAAAQLLPWMPVYRPVGGGVDRLFYGLFGFHPQPLYIFCWLLLALNVPVAYSFFRELTVSAAEALVALSLVLVHGSYSDLYYSAGTIYDRLCFLFTVAGLITFFRFRRRPGRGGFALICLLAVLAMGSKESGVAIVPLMVCCELIYFGPGMWRSGVVWKRLRDAGPLFATLAVLAGIFVFGRVEHTPGLVTNAAYVPRAEPGIWLAHVAEYCTLLTYRHIVFTPAGVGAALGLAAVAAIASRNRAMIFGWVFFAVSITPVALIPARAGYVLYLPVLGLGLYLAAVTGWIIAPAARVVPAMGVITFFMVTAAATWFHARNWTGPSDPRYSPELRLTKQLRHDYPHLPAGSKLLFVSDDFPRPVFDLLFNVRLLYHDKTIIADRMQGIPEQRPDPLHPRRYDHIFAAEDGRYAELDPANPAESIRLNILRGYKVGREMDIARPDHSAYVVSGLMDGADNLPSRWTAPRAEFKFQPRDQAESPPTAFTAKYWVAPFVAAAPAVRTLSVLVDGQLIGKLKLDQDGMKDIRLPVPGKFLRESGYTLVEMDVDNPYKDASGVEYGVILLRAGFQ